MPYRVQTHHSIGRTISRHLDYDRDRRNKEAQRFYRSTVWIKLRTVKLEYEPLCERCRSLGIYVPATTVHHRQSLTNHPDLALELENLESLCASCHSRHEAHCTHERANTHDQVHGG